MVRETVTGQYTLDMLEKCGLCKGSTGDEYISRIAVMRHFVEDVWVGPELKRKVLKSGDNRQWLR